MNKELLVAKYRTITVRNRTHHSQHVAYEGGDSAQVQPNATAKISTAGLTQIPNSRLFDLVSPTRAQLLADKIIEVNVDSQP